MLLSKVGYYADFVVYPLLLLPLGAVLVRGSTLQMGIVWAVVCFIGIAGFSLLEYGLHRFVLHHVPPFRRMHDLHHANPTAMIGTPTWLSAALIEGGVFLPLWREAGLNVACGLTFGLIAGYSPLRELRDFGLSLVVGAIGWTLAEYVLHRFVLHGVPLFRQMHALHHAAPGNSLVRPRGSAQR